MICFLVVRILSTLHLVHDLFQVHGVLQLVHDLF